LLISSIVDLFENTVIFYFIQLDLAYEYIKRHFSKRTFLYF
jgi:hypothetical protein